jgi:hypothetical protein
MRPLVAHCHLGLGKLYRRTGQGEQAQEHLAAATTMYRDMGMTYGRVPSMVEKRSGAFFRLVKCTTNAPPCTAATGGTRHGQGYQGRSAGAGA